MKVPFANFQGQYLQVKEAVHKGLDAVFEKGNFILGQPEKNFEQQFAKYCESSYGIGVNSGTDALHLGLRALGIGEGDEVLVPAFTFIATALAVSYTGAKPVFVDIQDDIYNIDPKKAEQAITPKTKAIMVVHLYGQAADMDEILTIAKKHNLKVIEDSAQAHGARYKGKRVGSLGDLSCFSFYPTKGLGAFGDGGMVVTNNEELSKKVIKLRDYGREDRYDHSLIGYNSRLDTVQAVVLSEKLKHLDAWNTSRAKHMQSYKEKLKDTPKVVLPPLRGDRTHVFQTFAVRIPNRDKICALLQEKGIGVLIHYPIPLHLQKAYAPLGYKKGDFPVSEKISQEILSLPMFPHMSEEETAYVCTTLKEILKNG